MFSVDLCSRAVTAKHVAPRDLPGCLGSVGRGSGVAHLAEEVQTPSQWVMVTLAVQPWWVTTCFRSFTLQGSGTKGQSQSGGWIPDGEQKDTRPPSQTWTLALQGTLPREPKPPARWTW